MSQRMVWIGAGMAIGLLTMTATAGSNVSFLPPSNYEMASLNPETLVVGDFNGDGVPDFLCTSAGSDSDGGEVTMLYGAPGGDYSDSDTFVAGGAPWGLALGDVTGDGRADAVVTTGGHEVTAVHVFRGKANGTFEPHVTLSAGKFPVAAAVADFNGDSINDIAVANNVLYGLTFFFNSGGGTFGPAQHMPGFAGMQATDMVAADLDNDDDIDVAVSHYNGVYVFLNDGVGVFSYAGGAGTNLLAESLGATDFNGDGFADLAIGYIYDGTVRICLNDGAGRFGGGGAYGVVGFHQDLATGDINRDGRPDVAAVGHDSAVVSVLVNTGGGVMEARQDFSTQAFPEGVQPTAVEIVDVDGDSWPDLVVACRNHGDAPTLAVLLQEPPALCPGDLDGDGSVGFADLNILLGNFNRIGAPGSLAGDLDGDGDVDFGDLNTLLGLYNSAC